MAVSVAANSVVARGGQQIALSSLFSVTASSDDPTYLIVNGLDLDEYTAGYNISAMGTLTGNGVSQKFSKIDDGVYAVGVLFTYQDWTGRYYSSTYGYFDQLTYKASTNANDNVLMSVVTSNDLSALNYVTDPYELLPSSTNNILNYVGSISVVTQPATVASAPSQATPNSVCAAALSFVGKAWNDNGCWVLASNIAAEAGASLPYSSVADIPGVANGEWIVAFNGPVSSSGDWESLVHAGEMVAFVTSGGSGHIATCVSGSYGGAMLVDNIAYEYPDGSFANTANDGSRDDVIISAPHAASDEFVGVDPSTVVIYELDAPVVVAYSANVTLAVHTVVWLNSLVYGSNPLASQSITEYQIYDKANGGSFSVNGITQSANSAATALVVNSLFGVTLNGIGNGGSDTLEVRAYNGSYWGDWQSVGVTVQKPQAPVVAGSINSQTWQQGQTVSFALPTNVFTDPQWDALTLSATLSSGAALPNWLSFNAATNTFTGVVPTGSLASFTIKVTATDTDGLSAAETFGVTVPALPPTITSATADQTWQQGKQISFVLPANTFTDPQGQTLTYSAAQAGGAALPSWLTFNATTGTFSGTVPTTGPQSLSLKVTATDTSGLTATETFGVNIPFMTPFLSNQTPTLNWGSGPYLSDTLPTNTFTDRQGLKLTYTAYQVLTAASPTAASWLRFDATTDTVSGVIPGSAAGTLTVDVVATNTSGLAVNDVFDIVYSATAHLVSTDVIGGMYLSTLQLTNRVMLASSTSH